MAGSNHRSGRPPRVLTVLTFYRPHWTGLTVFAQRIAEGLVATGAEVSVLCSHHDPSTPAEEELGGVRIHRVPTIGRLSRTFVMPGFPLALDRLVREHDVVHLHSPMAESEVVRAVCRRHDVPLIVTHQGDVVMPDGLGNQVVERIMRGSLGRTFRRADRVVTHNDDYARHSLVAVAGERARAIEPPVVFGPPAPGAVPALRAELGIGDRPVVGFAGRWVEEKGFDLLLRAAPLVQREVPDVVFAFAGERDVVYEDSSAESQPLRDALGSAYLELGLVLDPDRLAAFYAMADVVALPSRTDCNPSVQVEALLAGSPVVTSDIPGARSVVQRTGAGLLVPPEDPVALAEGLISVLSDPSRFDAAVAAVPAAYDPDLAVARYRALVDEVLAEAHPAPTPPSTVDALVAADPDTAYRRRVRWLAQHLGPDPGRVLDAGTGLGTLVHLLAETRPDVAVVGLDVDPARLVEARRSGVDGGLAAADLAALPHPDASFGTVVCSEVLEHVDDPGAVLAELRRVLVPGGRLLVTVPHADHPLAYDPPNRLLVALGRDPIRRGPFAGAWTDHQRLYRPAELRAELAAAGFSVDEVEEQTTRVLPFAHLLVYVVARGLSTSGALPDRWERSAGRYRRAGDAAEARPWPLRAALAVIDAVDRRNDRSPRGGPRHVSIVAAATRPRP